MEGDHRWSCSSFDPNWEDRNDPFESALSSLVSSPAASANGFVFRELIAKLGTISNNNNNSGEEMSPQSCQNPNLPGLGFLKSNPGFVSVPKSEMGDSREGSSVSEQNPGRELGGKPQLNLNSRKRKVIPKAKGAVKEKEDKVGRETDESSCAKGSKADEDDTKLAEPPKDYIHVRARRGQATDSHSLAERVRREKISERMKFLQDLVPGCNKVTGKAVVLDEIINYVQSLQRQVEFLSMKLATMNSRMDVHMEVILSKDILQLPSAMFQIDSSASGFPYGFPPQQMTMPPNGIHPENPTACSLNPLDMVIRQNAAIQIPSTGSYGNSAPQMPSFWEDDLHSIMGFPQNMMQDSQGTTPTPQMKTEL